MEFRIEDHQRNEQGLFECKYCNWTCNYPSQFEIHYRGKRHANKVLEIDHGIKKAPNVKKCCLCSKDIIGYGKSALPLATDPRSRCCKWCYNNLVVSVIGIPSNK